MDSYPAFESTGKPPAWKSKTMALHRVVILFGISLLALATPCPVFAQVKPRARDLGVPFEGTPGRLNAITDVNGVEVGHTTLISGQGKLEVGKGPIRTGVTAILPRGRQGSDPVFAGWFSLNGNGEMTGTTWVEESGMLEGPVMITNTHSVGVVRDAVIAHRVKREQPDPSGFWWSLPVVAETWDGYLNDINGFHVKPQHALDALDGARSGAVPEGNVGGGTGMICHEFKGGIGSSSRRLNQRQGGYTVAVLVQANHGIREQLRIAGVPVGQEIPDGGTRYRRAESGSIIIVVATDAPLLPHQLKRLARRASLGLARVGSISGNGSGDIFIAFSTANFEAARSRKVVRVEMLPLDRMDPLFEATVQATEEAIVNALVAAETMRGIDDRQVIALPHDRLIQVLKKYNRLRGPQAEATVPAASRAESPGRREIKVVVLDGTPFNRGMVHGKALRGDIHELVGLWKRDLSRQFRMDADTFIRNFLAGTDYLPAIRKWTPELLEEVRGIAEGAGIAFETMLAFQLVDEYWANGGGIAGEHCSGLGLAGAGDRPTYIAQNMDLEGFRDRFQAVLHVKSPDSGLESFIFTCPGLIALNGMNSRSLGVCVNTLLQLRPRRSGLPVAFVVRGLLERKTAEEAIGFLREVEHASGQNYILGSPAAVYDFECSAGKITRFVPEGRTGVVYHTNHPLANDDFTERYRLALEGDGKNDRSDVNSIARFQALQNRLRGDGMEPGLDAIRSALASRDSAEFPVCRHYTSPEAGFTFGSTIMVLSGSPELLVAAGPPDRAMYRSFSFAPAGR
jgi:L-aminopeptidase/D-esterase-like protein